MHPPGVMPDDDDDDDDGDARARSFLSGFERTTSAAPPTRQPLPLSLQISNPATLGNRPFHDS